MSSHHFVKEGQEPAVLILDALPFHIVAPLLEWAPLVMVTDKVWETACGWGIKIDAVLCKAGCELMEEQVKEQEPVTILLVGDGDDLLTTGMQYLEQTGQFAVHIICLDVQAILPKVNEDAMQISILDASHRWVFVNRLYKKWHPEGTELWLRKSVGDQIIKANGVPWQEMSYSVASSGLIEMKSQAPFWVGEKVF